MNKKSAELILASQSVYRVDLLSNAGLAFTKQAANIDERSVEEPLLAAGMDAGDVAEILARAKAVEVSKNNPAAYVIGCDQTLSLEGQLLHKPDNMEEARHRLLQMSGKVHELNSSVVLAHEGEVLWSHVEIAKLKMRKLDPGFIGRYLARIGDTAFTCAGAYQIEGEGLQLFEEVKGDFFAIMGLPLLPLLSELRQRNLMDG